MRIGRPSKVSSPKKVPVSPSKPPSIGGSNCGLRPSIQVIDQRRCTVYSLRQLDDVVVDISQPAEDRPHRHGAAEFRPCGVLDETPGEPAVAHIPPAVQKVEIACAVAHGLAPLVEASGLTRAV